VLGWNNFTNILQGGGGDDLLFGNGGGDFLSGGAGIDMASYATAPSGVYVFFGDGGNFTGDAQGDTFDSIEQLTGSNFNDVLGMDDGANKLVGNAGNDILFGEGGGDEFFGNEGFDMVSYANAPGGLYVFYSDLSNATGDAAGDQHFSSIEGVTGSAFNDIIGTGLFGDVLDGGAGDDVLYGQGGGDTFFGNAGFDTVSYALAPTGVYVFFADLGNATGDAAGDQGFFSIESVVGSAFNDIIGMGAARDVIFGGDGDDILFGQQANDDLYGGAGADRFAYLSTGWGADAIGDWQDGVDRIDFSRVAGLTFAALTLTQEAFGVRVTLGADSIFIGGANLASTTAADFIFGP
jgi:Ca2+-binding RTX toxin-like protein